MISRLLLFNVQEEEFFEEETIIQCTIWIGNILLL